MEKAQGKELASRLNLGEITSFRLHWLVCDLGELQRDLDRVGVGKTAEDLRTGAHAAFLARLERIVQQYRRLRWETKTLLGLDYEDEVAPLFEHLAKHAEYLQEIEKVKDVLRQKAEQILQLESQRIHIALGNFSRNF